MSDVAEKPAAPTVTVTSSVVRTDNTTLTLVTWDEPANTWGLLSPATWLECTGHEDSRPTTQCPSADLNVNLTVTSGVGTHTITGADSNAETLTRINSYRVRMRADNAEGEGAWSTWVTQSTNKENNTLPTLTAPAIRRCMW